jgi:hypothetical protein
LLGIDFLDGVFDCIPILESHVSVDCVIPHSVISHEDASLLLMAPVASTVTLSVMTTTTTTWLNLIIKHFNIDFLI